MFGSKKGLTDRLKDSLTVYLDAKFDDYRGQIAQDLSKGLAALAGLIAIWTLAIVAFIFSSITLALLLGWALSFWLAQSGYVLSFLIVAIIVLSAAYFLLKNKEAYIETPVYDIMSETLRIPEPEYVEAEPLTTDEPPATKFEQKNSNDIEDLSSDPLPPV